MKKADSSIICIEVSIQIFIAPAMAAGRILFNAVFSTPVTITRLLNEPIFGNARKVFYMTPNTKDADIQKPLTAVTAFDRVRRLFYQDMEFTRNVLKSFSKFNLMLFFVQCFIDRISILHSNLATMMDSRKDRC